MIGARHTAMIAQDGARGDLSDRMRRARANAFVGRTAELAYFASALAASSSPVLYLWGTAGIGKTALLHQFAEAARTAEREVVWVDARTIGRSPQAFESAIADARRDRRVLLVDSFEACPQLHSWIWNDILPQLPADALVVVAGRNRPDPRWPADPHRSTTVRVLPLTGLAPADATALLELRGIPSSLRASLRDLAGSHPLALGLAAEMSVRDPGRAATWSPHEAVTKTLLDRLVGDVPSAAHRRALEMSAHVLVTTVDLVRRVFGEQGSELFEWLRSQPFIEADPEGLRPHDLIRDLLDADLRWRDPDGWRAMNEQLSPYFVERALAAVGPAVTASQMALHYLHRSHPLITEFLTWRDLGGVNEDLCRPADQDAILQLAERLDGPSGVAPVEFWLRRQPGAFHVYRRSGTPEVSAFVCWLLLSEPDAGENAADPLIAAIWAHAERHGHARPGRRIAVQRFVNVEGALPAPSPTSDLIYMRGIATCMREADLAWTYVVMPEPGTWAPVWRYAGHEQLSGALSSVLAHHWWAAPVDSWLDWFRERRGSEAAAATSHRTVTALSRSDFEAALRDLLRNWHQPAGAHHPLLTCRLAGSGEAADRAERLRAAVEDAVDSIRGTARLDRLHRTLAATFFYSVTEQQAVAARLGMPFGTYRHRLTAAIRMVVDELWRREQTLRTGPDE
jgi:hypothetical protein